MTLKSNCGFFFLPQTLRVLTELVSKMRDMQMDKTELGCLRAIVLFNPGQITVSSLQTLLSTWSSVFILNDLSEPVLFRWSCSAGSGVCVCVRLESRCVCVMSLVFEGHEINQRLQQSVIRWKCWGEEWFLLQLHKNLTHTHTHTCWNWWVTFLSPQTPKVCPTPVR